MEKKELTENDFRDWYESTVGLDTYEKQDLFVSMRNCINNIKQIDSEKLESKPFIQECFTDNGEHSHWQLRGIGGELLWSEDKENNDIVIKQLDTWINNCKEQATIFNEQRMKTSEMCSDAMATAYNIVKEFLLKNK